MSVNDFSTIIALFLRILGFAIIARAMTSWFPGLRGNPLVEILYQVTDPILVPLSRLIPRIGMFDFTPMIAVIILFALSGMLGGG